MRNVGRRDCGELVWRRLHRTAHRPSCSTLQICDRGSTARTRTDIGVSRLGGSGKRTSSAQSLKRPTLRQRRGDGGHREDRAATPASEPRPRVPPARAGRRNRRGRRIRSLPPVGRASEPTSLTGRRRVPSCRGQMVSGRRRLSLGHQVCTCGVSLGLVVVLERSSVRVFEHERRPVTDVAFIPAEPSPDLLQSSDAALERCWTGCSQRQMPEARRRGLGELEAVALAVPEPPEEESVQSALPPPCRAPRGRTRHSGRAQASEARRVRCAQRHRGPNRSRDDEAPKAFAFFTLYNPLPVG
jgi:hypothetical protein